MYVLISLLRKSKRIFVAENSPSEFVLQVTRDAMPVGSIIIMFICIPEGAGLSFSKNKPLTVNLTPPSTDEGIFKLKFGAMLVICFDFDNSEIYFLLFHFPIFDYFLFLLLNLYLNYYFFDFVL